MTTLAPWISWFPALAAVLCGVCCFKPTLRNYAAPICVIGIFAAFISSLLVINGMDTHGTLHATAFEWIVVGDFVANFSYFIDPLTMIMLMVVTGIGTLVAIYAAGYMRGDRGYARFFFGVSLFVFAMLTLVLADNLVLLYLGWEGVGLCSYLLIGYYYDKPSAVAAAKKAFIVNRIGDLGFAAGIFFCYTTFGTVTMSGDGGIIEQARGMLESGYPVSTATLWIPFLLMLGAFGKSAQLPLYVWLPDAMEGPTPVSALIHAATMVTAGVYMIARMLPVFELSPYALPTVACVGGATAIFAATIALCQYDIKRIYAYSTVSQLGYMFIGVGALSTAGGVFHLFTHAFFKALLFLTAGSVMHALAGQLDLRKMSGLRHKMPVTCWLMFVGCLALAGFPFLAGFYSKDMILAAALQQGLDGHNTMFVVLAIVGLVTALLTAYYTFRLWFRVFMGPEQFEMGEDHHGDDGDTGHDDAHGHAGENVGGPHEMPWLMNGPLVVLALGALLAGVLGQHWIVDNVSHSTAAPHVAHGAHGADHGDGHHGSLLFGMDLHLAMQLISGCIALLGILIAWYFHLQNRAAADRWATRLSGVVTLLENKWYVDEIYDAVIVSPLRALARGFWWIDDKIINGVVMVIAAIPPLLGRAAQPWQRGQLQGYGLTMAAGIAILAFLIIVSVL